MKELKKCTIDRAHKYRIGYVINRIDYFGSNVNELEELYTLKKRIYTRKKINKVDLEKLNRAFYVATEMEKKFQADIEEVHISNINKLITSHNMKIDLVQKLIKDCLWKIHTYIKEL